MAAITLNDLFAAEHQTPAVLFEGAKYPWEVIARLQQYCEQTTGKEVIIGEGSVVEEGATIIGPTVVGKNCVIRQGAYIRGNVVINDNVTIGHSVELKNALVLSNAAVAHFNYVGDSIIGYKAHLAGGAVTANTKLIPGDIKVKVGGETFATGLQKFGAVVGDSAEIGSNVVLNPGSIIGKSSVVYPLVSWRGVLPANMIAKSATEVTERQ